MSSKTQITLAALGHVKRVPDPETGELLRPPAPGLYSDTVFVGDHSGSMASMGRAPEDGGRQFAEQYHDLGKSNTGQTPTHLSFVVFSTTAREVFVGDPSSLTQQQIDQCAYSMRPTNLTRFFDTAVEQLVAQSKRIREAYAALPARTRRLIPLNKFAAVVFATLTDGLDNMSNLCDAAALNRAFKRHKSEFGAKILFIAANMSAVKVGATYGIDADECLQMGADQEHSQEAFAAVTTACMRGASSGAANSAPSRVPPRPTFSTGARQRSCGVAEAARYGTALPAFGRQCTVPVQSAKGSLIQPMGSMAPPPPRPVRGGLQRQYAMNPFPGYGGGAMRGCAGGGGGRGCAGGGGGRGCAGGGGRGHAGPGPYQVQSHASTLPQSDDNLSDSDSADACAALPKN